MIIKIKENDIADDIRTFFKNKQINAKELCFENNTYFYLSDELKQENLNHLNDKKITIVSINHDYYFVSRKFKRQDTHIHIGNKIIGDNKLTIIGGPCSVESTNQIKKIITYLKESKTDFLRAGIFKPRTSPYSFQGLGIKALQILKDNNNDYQIVCELTSIEQVYEYANEIDILQVGARNMQNYELLKALAKTKKPIILKRGYNATINEWLAAAEYIFLEGNPNIILCERGVRSFETAYRNITDINAIVLVKKLSHLPVIIDPSHSTGQVDLVTNVALGCIMAGADGILVETHYNPEQALSDGAQSLNREQYLNLVEKALKLKEFYNDLNQLK